QQADRGATITGVGVAVVADLADVERPVAADLELQAVAPAAVARDGVAVVADLPRIERPVAARCLELTSGAAAVASRGVAVVAVLALILDTVAAGGALAVAAAGIRHRVRVSGPVVALLAC